MKKYEKIRKLKKNNFTKKKTKKREEKLAKKKRKKTLWITVVIYSVLCVREP
jgi:hypothetical protein